MTIAPKLSLADALNLCSAVDFVRVTQLEFLDMMEAFDAVDRNVLLTRFNARNR